MQQLYCRTTDLSDWVLQKLPAQKLLQSEIVFETLHIFPLNGTMHDLFKLIKCPIDNNMWGNN